MICLSPNIDKNLALDPPIDLSVKFIMDNVQIVPEYNSLTIVNDPIYHPFEDYIQHINSTHTIHFQVLTSKRKKRIFDFVFFKGMNLLSTHSIDLINIRIDDMNNSCLPLNLTETSLSCLLPKSTLNNIRDSEANVEVIQKKTSCLMS